MRVRYTKQSYYNYSNYNGAVAHAGTQSMGALEGKSHFPHGIQGRLWGGREAKWDLAIHQEWSDEDWVDILGMTF